MEKKFRIISIIFIIGCFVFYGGRFIYFHNKYTKKTTKETITETLATTIQKGKTVSSGDGLYNVDNTFIYKGTDVNNYLEYSNIMWRIVKINGDKSIVLVTDDTVSSLAFSNSSANYLKSNINEWLNSNGNNTGIFENVLNNKEKYLKKTTICLDNITNTSNVTCENKDENYYISLLGMEDYLNSKNEKSYIDNIDNIWLHNVNSNSVWHTSNGNLKTANITEIKGVKAVITLKDSVVALKGKGTKENPYIIEENNKLSFNSYVKLGNDTYTVLEKNDTYTKLVLNNLIEEKRNFSSYNSNFSTTSQYSIGYYLNNTYYNSLTYKDSLVDCDFYTGRYPYDYKNIYGTKVSAKVGMPSIADINVNNELSDYYLLNASNLYNAYSYSNDNNLKATSITYKKAIRPVVCIDSNSKMKGKGTELNPFELEV